MPYIKQEARVIYNYAVAEFLNLSVSIYQIVPGIKDEPLEKQDGIINYILTSVLLKLSKKPYDPENWNYYRQVYHSLHEFIEVFYAGEDKSYFTLNRAIGLLTSMINEFKRRKWSTPIRMDLESYLVSFLGVHVVPYEDAKIKENGDII